MDLESPSESRFESTFVVGSHQAIDARLLLLVQACIHTIDNDPGLVATMRDSVARWSNLPVQAEWRELLKLPWAELRERLLAETETGAALRQNAPLGGILSAAERHDIFQTFALRLNRTTVA